MPMDFPDMNSLINCAKVHNFRQPNESETEEHFRQDLAEHVRKCDPIEAEEILNKVGWDRWSQQQSLMALLRNLKD